MKINDIPFSVTDWSKVPATEHAGETGTAFWKTLTLGTVRVRLVEYTPGYLADHWCSKGHFIYVVSGRLVTELQDGRTFELTAGMGYQVSDDAEPHRSQTDEGATLYIVD